MHFVLYFIPNKRIKKVYKTIQEGLKPQKTSWNLIWEGWSNENNTTQRYIQTRTHSNQLLLYIYLENSEQQKIGTILTNSNS